MNQAIDKQKQLLAFLKATAIIKRKRVSSYGDLAEKVLWLEDVPQQWPECCSPFLSDKPDDFGAIWLEVQKKRMPVRPPVPPDVADWVRAGDLDQPENDPKLLPELRKIVKQEVPAPEASTDAQGTIVEEVPEPRRLADHPEVEDAWRGYLVEKWRPWAQEMRRWREAQGVYESLDFMRRRLEEAEERYELVLAVGLLQWRDPTGTAIERHVLTAPAELALDAARGILTAVPAASFDRFRVELDMLDLQHRPRLNEDKLGKQLEELDIQAWNIALVAPILREIANSLRADAQVDETFARGGLVDERPRLSVAPALILRERRSTAYEELIRKLLEKARGVRLEGTPPWLRLIQEGDPASSDVPARNTPASAEADRFLFPLPTNEEQRQIAHRLQAEPCVLVKGPPGTGKSHTIANLICHLLAKGDRVLVTAHAPKALAVLRDLLPEEIRDLCVTAMGSSREDQRLLEESVRGILRRKDTWRGQEAALCAIEKAEDELRQREGELARVERDVRAAREAETYSHQLPGGYSGTAAQIARMLSKHKDEFDWFPELSADAPFPLDASQSDFLTEAHASFTPDVLAELDLEVGAAELPSPDEFQALVARLRAAEESSQRANRGVENGKRESLESFETKQLRALRNAIWTLNGLALRASRSLGELANSVLLDLLASAGARWTRLAADSGALLRDAAHILEAIGSARVELPDGVAEEQLRIDVERRLEHFEAGGWKGFGVFAPRVVRETRYIVERCRVDGKKVARLELLRCVRDQLELRRKVGELREMWGDSLAKVSNPRQAVSRAEELTAELRRLLAFFQSEPAGFLASMLGSRRAALASADDRDDWLKTIDGLLASRDALGAQQEIDQLLGTVRGQQYGSKAHPCLCRLEEAVRACDDAAYRAALHERERIRQQQQRLARYESLLKELDGSCPGLATLLRRTGGDPVWTDRVRRLREAWEWAAAAAWLRRVSDASAYKTQEQIYHRVKREIEAATERLVSLRAWKAFFDRVDDRTLQCLEAWTRAVDRIGKGTGKHAYRHRLTARRYLMECVPSIPAWVMPLHKLWDSVDAEPGLFDTVIVDEASQAGIDALVLLLLAKRIIVVGDDKQNSPEAVGILEDDIARLAREHLGTFLFRNEFRPDTSLFDHAARAFRTQITLREHFRCVPEIIRFSNEICYRDAPLIPLRQAPPNRLPPLRSRFVAEAACEGDGQRIMNRAEAEALVETLVKLVDDEAYKGKTMGVIALQGHAQSRLIERLLAERLDPRVIEQRRLRCGEPATFQGDQRDIIFLSLVIASKAPHRALTRLPDQRRFNVAMSRARDQVWLFHSVKPHDLGPEDLRRRLVMFFEQPANAAVDALFEQLDHLEREAKGPRLRGTQPKPYDSWFEVDVALELLRRKFRVRPQVEVADRRIDLVVEGVDARIAVECDGDQWHGPEQYDQDMARQRQLERAGWTFVRVRESDFYADPKRAVDAVVESCEKLGIRPVNVIGVPECEPPRARASGRGSPTGSSADTTAPSKDPDEPGDNPDAIAVENDMASVVVGPFTGYSKASGFPDPREASAAMLRKALRQIIERDGPLTRKSVYRLYGEGCPKLRRVGKTVRQALNKALRPMLRAGEIIEEDELGDSSPEDHVLRMAGTPAVNVRPAGRRDLLEIPPSELLAVLRQLHPEPTPPTDGSNTFCRELLEHYGFSRLTKARRDYLARVLRLWPEPGRSSPNHGAD